AETNNNWLGLLNSVYSEGEKAIVSAISYLKDCLLLGNSNKDLSGNLAGNIPSTPTPKTLYDYEEMREGVITKGEYTQKDAYTFDNGRLRKEGLGGDYIQTGVYDNVGKGKAIEIDMLTEPNKFYRFVPPQPPEGTEESRKRAYKEDPEAYYLLASIQKILGNSNEDLDQNSFSRGRFKRGQRLNLSNTDVDNQTFDILTNKSTEELLELEQKYKKILFNESQQKDYSINSLALALENNTKAKTSAYDKYALDSSVLALEPPRVTSPESTLSTDRYTVDETLKLDKNSAVELIQQYLKDTNLVNQNRYNTIFDRVNRENSINQDIFGVEKDVIDTRYAIEEQNFNNETQKRLRSFELLEIERAKKQPNRELEILNRQLTLPENIGRNALGLQNQITKKGYEIDILNTRATLSLLQLELGDKKDEIAQLESLKKTQTGSDADATQKQIDYIARSKNQTEGLINTEKSLLEELLNNRYAVNTRADKVETVAREAFGLQAQRYSYDDSYAAMEALNTEEYEPSRFKRDALSKEIQERREMIALLERNNQIKQKALDLNYTEAELNTALASSAQLYEANLIKIGDSTNTLAGMFKETLTSPINEFFSSLITGSNDLGTTVTNLAVGVLKNLGNIAAQMLSNYLMSQLLGSVFGFGGGTNLGGGLGGI
ncbi:MAG: hypothetical protein ACRDBG_24760, partial [Waterburya sp.]